MVGKAGRYEVLLTRGAEQDLEALYDYIAEFDCPENAARLLDQLMAVVESLEAFPESGSHPKELLALGIREYRQVVFTPYRVICRILGQQVVIFLIADGRRDFQTLLERRMLRA